MWNICREVCFSACFSRGIRDDIEEEDDQVSSYAVFLSFIFNSTKSILGTDQNLPSLNDLLVFTCVTC